MFKIQIATGNDAFDEQEGNAGPELARILDEIADRIRNGVADGDYASVRDLNGSTTGEWTYQSEVDMEFNPLAYCKHCNETDVIGVDDFALIRGEDVKYYDQVTFACGHSILQNYPN